VDYFYSAATLRSRGALWPSFAPALTHLPAFVYAAKLDAHVEAKGAAKPELVLSHQLHFIREIIWRCRRSRKLEFHRAESGASVVREYRQITGADDDDQDVLSDLLTDLMHWTDMNNVDFTDEMRRAQISP
jgi:hypothetical protein